MKGIAWLLCAAALVLALGNCHTFSVLQFDTGASSADADERAGVRAAGVPRATPSGQPATPMATPAPSLGLQESVPPGRA